MYDSTVLYISMEKEKSITTFKNITQTMKNSITTGKRIILFNCSNYSQIMIFFLNKGKNNLLF